jgi:8-oxo-dGTP pyrophosphatase MutT (NUDIX family)
MYAFSSKSVINVQAILFTESDRVVLVRHTYGRKPLLVLPGGILGRDEQPRQGIIREVGEELGAVPDIHGLLTATRGSWLITLTYYGVVQQVSRRSKEICEVQVVDSDTLRELIRLGEAAVPLEALSSLNAIQSQTRATV